MIIDAFSHILPANYRKALYKKATGALNISTHGSLEVHHNNIPALFDLKARFGIMDAVPESRQVLTLPAPPVEVVTSPQEAPELARLVNDELSELVAKYPERFIAGVACLPMNNMDAALKEAERALKELKLKGVQIYSSINGKPLDSPEFWPLYETMEQYGMPIWIHPIRARDVADYRGEDHSKYRIFHTFGWPYETTAAMTRLVFSGVLEKYPDLKIVTHHCGGMVPFFANRLQSQGQGMVDRQAQFTDTTAELSLPVLDYFRKFYADTAIEGNTCGVTCCYDFFGSDHVLFGSDGPYGGAERLTAEIKAVKAMPVTDQDKQKILEGNILKLLKI